MVKHVFLFIAGLTLIPSAASALADAPNAAALIRKLGGGWSGMNADALPRAPETPHSMVVAYDSDEIREALAALVKATVPGGDCIGETVRRLGLKFTGDSLKVKGIGGQADRRFSITSLGGKTKIIIEEFSGHGGSTELRSYLLSTEGGLEAAALTTKPEGKFKAEKIDLKAAKPGFESLLRFWVKYYQDNLKRQKT